MSLSHVNFEYGRGSFGLTDLSFEVSSGEVVGLIGPNGSGKTTALRVALGLLDARDGNIEIGGISIRDDPRAARVGVAVVPDTPRGFEHLTLAEYLRLYGAVQRADPGYQNRAEVLLEPFGLRGALNQCISELSSGTRRKATAVAAFALARPLLVVDEATSALDPEAVILLGRLIERRSTSGSGCLIATQDLAFAERVCHRVVLLSDGRTLAVGTPQELAREYGAKDLFGVFTSATGLDDVLDQLDACLDSSI
ncbi:MAG: ABC transporter ATP-binding protein [Candidatus Limnocylindrales bacterium]